MSRPPHSSSPLSLRATSSILSRAGSPPNKIGAIVKVCRSAMRSHTISGMIRNRLVAGCLRRIGIGDDRGAVTAGDNEGRVSIPFDFHIFMLRLTIHVDGTTVQGQCLRTLRDRLGNDFFCKHADDLFIGRANDIDHKIIAAILDEGIHLLGDLLAVHPRKQFSRVHFSARESPRASASAWVRPMATRPNQLQRSVAGIAVRWRPGAAGGYPLGGPGIGPSGVSG